MYYIILAVWEFFFSYLRRIITKLILGYIILIMDMNTSIGSRKIMSALWTNGDNIEL
jgi:hypothetical protein